MVEYHPYTLEMDYPFDNPADNQNLSIQCQLCPQKFKQQHKYNAHIEGTVLTKGGIHVAHFAQCLFLQGVNFYILKLIISIHLKYKNVAFILS